MVEGSGWLPSVSRRRSNRIQKGVIDSEEMTVGKRTVLPRVKGGTTIATSTFGRFTTEDVWGGLIAVDEAADFIAAQRLAASGDAHVEQFRPEGEHHVASTIRKAVDRGIAPAAALERWEAYASARARLSRACPGWSTTLC